MMLAVARHFKQRESSLLAGWCSPSSPTRSIGDKYRAQWLVDNRPDLFAGVSGRSARWAASRSPRRATMAGSADSILIETAEKGLLWMRLRRAAAPATARWSGDDNAVTTIARAVTRNVRKHEFPLALTDTVAAFRRGVRGDRPEPRRRRCRGRDQTRSDGPDAGATLRRHRQPDHAGPATRPTSSRRPPRRWWTARCCWSADGVRARG